MRPATAAGSTAASGRHTEASASVIEAFLERHTQPQAAAFQLDLHAPGPPDSVTVTVPGVVVELVAAALHHLASGHDVAVVRLDAEVTTQQAADLLLVSRPHLVGLLESGALPFRKVGTHRRVRVADVLAYKAEDDRRRARVAAELTALGQEMGLV